MGILNVTPDSFSGDAVFHDVDAAVARAEAMVRHGADLIDVGGESTRPGADAVPTDEELRRVIPVIEKLAPMPVPVSIDTRKPEVAGAAIAAGASLVNDVNALREDGMLDCLAASAAGVVLMHMQGDPQTMQQNPHYDDVVGDVANFLRARARAAHVAGVMHDRIAVDPGIGFGKTLDHNLELLRRLDEIVALGYPVLVGTSRKRFIGQLTGAEVNHRTWGTAATVALAIARGAAVLRVHDVEAMKQAAAVADAIVRGAKDEMSYGQTVPERL
jgi:dihydropteroate synthase